MVNYQKFKFGHILDVFAASNSLDRFDASAMAVLCLVSHVLNFASAAILSFTFDGYRSWKLFKPIRYSEPVFSFIIASDNYVG